MKTNIIVQLQYEATHNWPDCNILEAQYLKNNHRHIFYITCKKEVSHSDREIEIITFKRKIEAYLNRFRHVFGKMSCENIAELLVKRFKLNYCKVLEDNENGAEVLI